MYKDHPIYGEYFSVSKNGEIFSKRTNKVLKTQISKRGYRVFTTRFYGKYGKCKGFFIHKLVAETWLENPENKPQVNHIDGDKLNNHISNLEWVTGSENMLHAFEIGLAKPKIGTNHKNSKISAEQLIEILASNKTTRELGTLYGIHHTNISRIKRGASYFDFDSK